MELGSDLACENYHKVGGMATGAAPGKSGPGGAPTGMSKPHAVVEIAGDRALTTLS